MSHDGQKRNQKLGCTVEGKQDGEWCPVQCFAPSWACGCCMLPPSGLTGTERYPEKWKDMSIHPVSIQHYTFTTKQSGLILTAIMTWQPDYCLPPLGVKGGFRNVMSYLMGRSGQEMRVRTMCFYDPLTMFTLMFSASVKQLNSSTLSFFQSPPLLYPSACLIINVLCTLCMHVC